MAKLETFGEYIRSKRSQSGITQKEIAGELGITTVYLCDIEKGRRYPPTSGNILHHLAQLLKLKEDEKSIFFDLAGYGKGCVSPDLQEYIMSSDIVRKALRIAKERASQADWESFIHKLGDVGCEKG